MFLNIWVEALGFTVYLCKNGFRVQDLCFSVFWPCVSVHVSVLCMN
jgi:hypothetical protein